MELSKKIQFFFSGGSPAPIPLDPDAEAYIARVETADGQTLEPAVKTAINDFVLGVKDDGDWPALKASCILAGARTLNGALEPLVGVAPTNFNFVSADYDRKTGLKGDGATKYLNSNRDNSADPQNSKHIGLYLHDINDNANLYAGVGDFRVDGASNLYSSSLTIGRAYITHEGDINVGFTPDVGYVGASRANSSDYTIRVSGSNQVAILASQTPFNGDIYIFARNASGTPTFHSTIRKSFYSIGEDINLANLDARISAFMSALNTAI